MKKATSPSKPDFPRDRRLKLIRELFARWGRMNQQQLYERLSARLGEDLSTLRRTLYRDIEYLVREGELVEHCTTRDGVPIENFDPEIHKSVLKNFSLPDYEGQTVGGSLVEQVGGRIFLSPAISREIKIEESSITEREKHFNVYFSVANLILRIRLPLEQLPFTFLIARVPDIGTIQPKFEELEKRFGRRLGFLQLPINTLSSQRELDRPGHALIQAKDPTGVTVTDLNSKNGTFWSEIDLPYSEKLSKGALSFMDNTATSNWASRSSQIQWSKLASGQSQGLASPVLIRLSEDFPILIRTS